MFGTFVPVGMDEMRVPTRDQLWMEGEETVQSSDQMDAPLVNYCQSLRDKQLWNQNRK